MSNPKSYVRENFTHVTPAIMRRVAEVLSDRAVKRYSSLLVYRTHNELFQLKERPQTCDACVITRAHNIHKWNTWYEAITGDAFDKVEAPTETELSYDNIRAVYCIDAEGDKELEALRGYITKGIPAFTDEERIIIDARIAELSGEEPAPLAAKASQAAPEFVNIFDFNGGGELAVTADGSVYYNGEPATPNMSYRRADGYSIVTDAEGKQVGTATTYAEVVAKYGLVIGDSVESEAATISTSLEGNPSGMEDSEQELLLARWMELSSTTKIEPDETEPSAAPVNPAPAGDAPAAPVVARIVVQKVNKETYKPEGESLFADFTPSAEDATKGTIVNPLTGNALAAGTYSTEDTTKVLKVSPGGAAAYKTIG